MKHAISLLVVTLTLAAGISAQEDIKNKPLLTGAEIDTANDWFVIGDASVTGTNPVLRRMKFSEMENVEGMFATLEPALGNPASNGYVLSSTTGGARSWIAMNSNLTSGPVTSSSGVSAIADGALSIAKTNGLQTALDGKQTATGAVWVTYASGAKVPFIPTADTDAARTDALEAAWASANSTSGAEIVDLYPAAFYLDTAPTTVSGIPTQFIVETGRVLRLNGARLYHTATEQSYVMFAASLGTGNLAHDWAIFGPGILEGTVPTPSGIFTADDTATGEVGILVGGGGGYSYRYLIHGITGRYFKHAAIGLYNASYPTWKFTSGTISNCVLDYNIVGLAGFAGHEFVKIESTTASFCKRGYHVDAGNWTFNNCQANACTGDGLYVHSSGNNAHGIWNSGILAHNYVNAVRFAPGVTNGWTFSGAHISGSDGTTPNKMQLDGYGINITGGQFDSPIVTTAVNSGLNAIKDVYISNVATATVSGMFSGSRIKLKIDGCQTATGMWTHNDLQTYTFADNTAALAGGLVAGEKYKDSSGNLKVAY